MILYISTAGQALFSFRPSPARALNHPRCAVWSSAQIALPKSHNVPSQTAKQADLALIPSHVSFYLGDPISGVMATAKAQKPLLEVSTMPEIAIAKDD